MLLRLGECLEFVNNKPQNSMANFGKTRTLTLTALGHIARAEAEAARAAALIDRLEQETRAKAYRGELVAQDGMG